MAAINLDSLNTFWQSIKTYFAGRLLFRNQELTIFEDTSGTGVSTAQLTRALENGYAYRITFVTNDNCGYTQTLRWFTGYQLFFLINFFNNPGTTVRSYIKMARVEIGSNNDTLSITNQSQINVNASSVTESISSTSLFKIVKVVRCRV